MKMMFSSHLAALQHVTGSDQVSAEVCMLRNCLDFFFLNIQPVGSLPFSSFFVCLIPGTCVVAGASSCWKTRALCSARCQVYCMENWQVDLWMSHFFPRKKWTSIVLNPFDCVSLLLRANEYTGEYFCLGAVICTIGINFSC